MALAEVAPHAPSPEEHLSVILERYERHHSGERVDEIVRAYELAVSAHAGQTRKSGEPFILHPLIVTSMLATYGMDADTIVAAILHDTVEDTDVTLDDIRAQFPPAVAQLIDGVTKLDRIAFSTNEEHQAATIRKMVIAMAADIRVLLIKLADRLHNMRTIGALRPEKQERIARQTLEVYAPLAHRLGVQEIKHELEERCFVVLYPKRARELDELISRRAPEREEHLREVMDVVRSTLESAGVAATVTGRPKHLYSIYRKMQDSGLAFEEIYDLIGIRIITTDVRDCYAALGLVHTKWPPIHGRFKDYIAMPKFNLYQSIHTTVVGPGGKALEVQIRSEEMHQRAEVGIAAHWRYKEGDATVDVPFLADIRFLQDEYADPEEFLSNLKLDLYQDEVFALTPKGKVIQLSKGATPVDFAYRIHTEVGHHTVGARVNGRLVPLSTPLESGDIVEIITSRAQDAHPSSDWLKFVKSSRAASKIRQYFTRERRTQAHHDGRDLMMKLIAKEGLGLSANQRDEALRTISTDLGYLDLEAMFIAVGESNLNPGTAVGRLVKMIRPELDEEEDTNDLLQPPRLTKRRRPARGIIVEGLDDMMVSIARCCAPVPGDDIVGFVTIGRGVSVHRADCANIASLGERAERIIEVSWAPESAGSFFVWIQVEALDRPRLLRDVTTVLSDMGANIQASSSGTDRDRVAILRYEIELSDPAVLESLTREIKRVDGVFDAYRLVPGSRT